MLNEHYDTRSKERKRKHRLKILEKLFDGYGDQQATIDPSSLDEALFNESGQIDPQVLLSVDTTADETSNSGETASNSPTEDGDNAGDDEVAEDQATFDRFNLIAHPALLPLFGGLAVSSWLPDRLRRELQSMAAATESSPYPTLQRARKGIATWFLFACLVGLNLALHGLTPVGLT